MKILIIAQNYVGRPHYGTVFSDTKHMQVVYEFIVPPKNMSGSLRKIFLNLMSDLPF